MSKGEELRLGTMRGFVLHWEPRHPGLLSIFFVRGTILRPAVDTKKYKLWILPKEFTTILKKVTLKKICKKTKTILEEITQEMLNGDK